MIQPITSADELKEEIRRLENQQDVQFQLLKEQLHLVRERLRPVNVIKNTIREAFSSPKKMISGVLIGASGLITASLLRTKKPGSNSSLFRKFSGILLKSGLSAIISANGNSLKETFLQLFSKFFSAKSGRT